MTKLFLTSRLRELREDAGMTQQEFVGMLDVWLDKPVSLSSLQKWEQGRKPIKPDLALELARYFKVNVAEIVERK